MWLPCFLSLPHSPHLVTHLAIHYAMWPPRLAFHCHQHYSESGHYHLLPWFPQKANQSVPLQFILSIFLQTDLVMLPHPNASPPANYFTALPLWLGSRSNSFAWLTSPGWSGPRWTFSSLSTPSPLTLHSIHKTTTFRSSNVQPLRYAILYALNSFPYPISPLSQWAHNKSSSSIQFNEWMPFLSLPKLLSTNFGVSFYHNYISHPGSILKSNPMMTSYFCFVLFFLFTC